MACGNQLCAPWLKRNSGWHRNQFLGSCPPKTAPADGKSCDLKASNSLETGMVHGGYPTMSIYNFHNPKDILPRIMIIHE